MFVGFRLSMLVIVGVLFWKVDTWCEMLVFAVCIGGIKLINGST